MVQLFNAVFYQPIFNLLVFLYNVIPGHDLGLAIILLTVIVKLVLWPLSNGALRSQKALTDIQPKLEALKKQYPGKDQQETLAKEMMALYSREKVSPFSSCLPILIQLPVFIALYQAMSHGLESQGFDKLYPFVANPGKIVPSLFGFVDLAKANIALALLAGVSQYFQAKMMVTRQQPRKTPGAGDEDMLATMNKQMLYMMPVLTVILGWKLPGGLSLYWLLTNLLTVLQQKIYFMKADKGPDASAPAVAAPKA